MNFTEHHKLDPSLPAPKVCFHDTKSSIYVTSDRMLIEQDIVTGQCLAQTILPQPVAHLFYCGGSHCVLVFLKEGTIMSLDGDHELRVVTTRGPVKSELKKPLACIAASGAPRLYFALVGVHDLYEVDLTPGREGGPATHRMGHPKGITGIAPHPSRPLVVCPAELPQALLTLSPLRSPGAWQATCSQDGRIRLWETDAHTLVATLDEAAPLPNEKKIKRNPLRAIAWAPEGTAAPSDEPTDRPSLLVSVDAAGRCACWTVPADPARATFAGGVPAKADGRALVGVAVAPSPDMRLILCCDDRGQVDPWLFAPPGVGQDEQGTFMPQPQPLAPYEGFRKAGPERAVHAQPPRLPGLAGGAPGQPARPAGALLRRGDTRPRRLGLGLGPAARQPARQHRGGRRPGEPQPQPHQGSFLYPSGLILAGPKGRLARANLATMAIGPAAPEEMVPPAPRLFSRPAHLSHPPAPPPPPTRLLLSFRIVIFFVAPVALVAPLGSTRPHARRPPDGPPDDRPLPLPAPAAALAASALPAAPSTTAAGLAAQAGAPSGRQWCVALAQEGPATAWTLATPEGRASHRCCPPCII
ncbi:hypothetical protein PAPYR_1466 [Paratrimastix pyriformis]|uniref:Uncharacterized protein n=1 Tax=Paratrimastix pyriformis TaxID=342808 RepID=A0ABQ8UWS4_9EUKA|nr:hypothetical protein PAPYR_1466 [Paratrimastix pyriformis]